MIYNPSSNFVIVEAHPAASVGSEVGGFFPAASSGNSMLDPYNSTYLVLSILADLLRKSSIRILPFCTSSPQNTTQSHPHQPPISPTPHIQDVIHVWRRPRATILSRKNRSRRNRSRNGLGYVQPVPHHHIPLRPHPHLLSFLEAPS